MRLRKLMVPVMAAAVVMAGQVTSVSAQEREGGRRGGPGARAEGGRFGGPGMMFGRGGQRGGDQLLVGLLAMDAVRDELKLDEAQREGLRKLSERNRPERPDFDFRAASEAERAAFATRMREQAAARAAEAKEQLEELLLPGQMERLEQIALQVQGPAALATDADIAKKLELSDEKVAAMRQEIEANAEKTRELMVSAGREQNFDGFREKAQAMRQELEEKLLGQLTSEQRAKFEELKGAKFDMPERPAFDRGGRGGQRGPGALGGGRRGGEAGEGRRGEGRRGGEGRGRDQGR